MKRISPLRTVGKSFRRIDGPAKVSGEALYTADVRLPGMLWAKALRSPLPHARIVHINAESAKRISGIFCVLTAADFPDVLTGRCLYDMPILAREKVRFVGERVAVVAAEDPDLVEEALASIEVEYEELPAVFNPLDAVRREDAPLLHPGLASYKGVRNPPPDLRNVHSHARWSLGDVEQGLKESDHVFENTFTTQHVHQGYLEPHAAVVAIDEGGRIQAWMPNKAPYRLKEFLSEAINVHPKRIHVNITPIGGDFGGKGYMMDVPLCYQLAKLTRRPVKMVMTYSEELMAGNPRHPSVITIKSGVRKDGRLLSRQITIFWNAGAYGAMKPKDNLGGAARAAGSYRIPNVKIDAYCVYTNCVPCGYFRAPGHPQVTFAVESHMDMIAEALGIDRLEVRLMNALQDGDVTPKFQFGHKVDAPSNISMRHVKCMETIQAAVKASSWGKPKSTPNVGRGLAVSHRKVGIGDANARLTLRGDGRFSLLTTYPDTGTGSYTILCQIVAEVLGVPFEHVKLEVGSTDSFHSEEGTGAARVTHVMGKAAFEAAVKLREAIHSHAAEIFRCSTEEIVVKGGRCVRSGRPPRALSFAQLAKTVVQKGKPALESQSYINATEIPPEACFSAQVAEVKVDVDTGQVDLISLTTAHDVGAIINPIAHQGQIEGAVMQGLGFALMEEIVMEDGRIMVLNLGDYKLPNIRDIPRLKTVLVQEQFGPAPFQGKEIGESPIAPVAAAIANAVYDAVGVRIMDLPITAEKVYAGLQARVASFKLPVGGS